jgi:HlyD family type I secretion membrane fusion protein
MTARILPFFTRPGLARRGAAERAFLPAALEIVESPASPTLRLTAFVIALFLTSACVWSYFGWIDIVATAPGKIIARSRTKVVQPYDTGVVRAIRVADGDRVEPGQVLIELDPSISSADETRYSDMLVQARLDQTRLNALLNPGDPADFSNVSASPDLISAARAEYEAEMDEHAAKLAKLDREAAQKRAEAAGIDAEIAKIDASLPLVRGRASIREDGLKLMYGSKLQLLEAQQQVVDMEHQRVVEQRKHEASEAELAELTVERAQTAAEFKHKILVDLAKANQDAAEASGELSKAQRKTDLRTLTAPVGGTVQDLAVHTLGGVVTPAQQLLRIVPSDGGIEVEAAIANQDVGFVEVGQETEIKIDTFPFTRYGLIRGRIREIAHDAVDDPQTAIRRESSQSSSDAPENVERSRQLVYTARIALENTQLNVDGKPVELTPGMSVTAEIKTGRRSVLDFLLSPLSRYTHDSLRER